MKRRKYHFKTREDAERMWRESRDREHMLTRGLMAMYAEAVEWLDVPEPYVAGYYRIGLFDRESHGGMKVIVAFWPPNQSPSVDVHDAVNWANQTIEAYAYFAPSDDEGYMIRHMAEIVRGECNELLAAS